MSLRIIAGSLKGRVIPSPISPGTRPTTDMWRSAMFSALEERLDLTNTKVVDLFAGTGALGLECLSRGSSHITFVEKDHGASQQLRSTLKEFHVSEQTSVIEDDVARFLRTTNDTFDLIIADPPYALRVANKLRDLIAERHLLSEGGWLLLEHGDTEFLLTDDRWETSWHKERSGTMVTLQQWKPSKP